MNAFPDIARVTEILRSVAAEEIMPRFRSLADEDIWHKKPGDIATTADLAAERRLIDTLTKLVPGSLALAEETAQGREHVARCFAGDDPVWIIDPVDGTANFAAGRDGFAVMVAYWHKGKVRAGWILMPARERIAVAEQGGGAWSEDGRLHTARSVALDRAHGFLGRRLRENHDIASQFGGFVNQRCCGMHYLLLASGESHFAHYRGLKPWDHAAGDLIVREAGGVSCGLDRRGYDPGAPDRHGLLAACGATLWRRVADAIRPAVLDLPQPR